MSVAPEQIRQSETALRDKRRYYRVSVNLLGRFMLEDRKEYPCQTKNISPGSVALITPIETRIGERIVAYIDHIGRVEGRVTRIFKGGLAMSINATSRKRDKLAAQLTWLANRHELSLPEDRRHDRVTSIVSSVAVGLPDGREFRARVIDISLSGAALSLDITPPLGSVLIVGKIRASVVRHFEGGIAIEFAAMQTRESLRDNLS